MWSCLLAVWILGCGTDQVLPTDAPTTGQRVALPWVALSTKTDILTLHGALDESCTFMEPLVENASTNWPPAQMLWVIYDEESAAEEGDAVENTYFIGDVLTLDQFDPRSGKDPLGFSFLGAFQQMFLNIRWLTVSGDGTTVDAELGNPVTALLRSQSLTADPDCRVINSYCELPCGDEDYRPLAWIQIEVTGLNVSDVIFHEE